MEHSNNRTAQLEAEVIRLKERIEQFEKSNANCSSDDQLSKLNLIISAAKIGLWDFQVSKGDPNPLYHENVVTYSPEYRKMLGYSNEFEYPNIIGSWSDKLHPDDKEQILEDFTKYILDRNRKTSFEIEFRLLKKNREYACFSAFGSVIRDEEGYAHHVAGAIKDITVEKMAMEELKEAKKNLIAEKVKLQTLGDNMPYGIIYRYAYNMDTGAHSFPYVSAGWKNVMGYSAEIALNDIELAFSFIHPDDFKRVLDAVDHSIKTMTRFDEEFRLIIDGVIRWVRKTAHPRYEDRLVIFDGIGINITETKEAQEKLLSEKERLQTIGDNIPNGVLFRFMKEIETGKYSFKYVSAQWEDVMGYSSDVALNYVPELIFSTVHPDDLPLLKEKLEYSAQTLTLFDSEHRNVIDGKERWVHMMSQTRSENGFIIWDGIGINITARKGTEQKLALEKERIAMLGNNLPDVAIYQFIIDLRTHQLRLSYVSGSWKTITGISSDVATSNINTVLALIHPEDLPSFMEKIENIEKSLTKFYAEIRLVIDGKIRWVRLSSRNRRENMSIIADGTLLDITHFKEAERSLNLERNRLQTLGDNIPDGSLFQCVRDTRTSQMRLTYVSSSWESVTGMSSEVALTNFTQAFSAINPEYIPLIMRATEESAATMSDFNVEFRVADRWKRIISRPRREDDMIIWDGILSDITASKEAHIALQAEKERLETLGNKFPNGILQRFVYDKKTKQYYMEYLSSRWEEITGLTRRSVSDDITPYFDIMHPEDRQPAMAHTELSRKNLSDFDIELRIFKNGEIRWLHIISKPYETKNKVIWDGIMTDVTEQKSAAAALIESEQKHRFILDNTQELFKIVDFNTQKITFVGGHEIYGYAHEEMMQQDLYTLFQPVSEHHLAQQIEDKSEDYYNTKVIQSIVFRDQLLHKDGHKFWVESSMQLIPNEEGKLAYIVSVDRNIDDIVKKELELTKYRQHLEELVQVRTEELNATNEELTSTNEELTSTNEELQSTNEELESTNDALLVSNERYMAISENLEKLLAELTVAKVKAEEADNFKSVFIAKMSHEMRTSMNGIFGFFSLLQYEIDATASLQANDYLRIISNNCNTLLQLLNDLIDISKLDAHQIQILPQEIDLNFHLLELNQLYSQMLTESGKSESVQLILDQPSANEKIFVDPVRLTQIMTNLVSNAIKFTEKGSIHFGYENYDGNFLLFYVKDTGTGIEQKYTDIIFDQFQQVDELRHLNSSGTGLGLAICKNLAELMGGKIWVESELNKGADFFFTVKKNNS